ncbi:MAG: tetratricopeptide repeat protein [Minicystis sp.]
MIRRALLRAALLSGCMLLAACKENAAPPSPAASASASGAPSASAAADDSPLTIAKRLARTPPGGTTAVDREIQRLQKSLETTAGLPDGWILLGRAWVRKARESSDPGYYLNAKACADVAADLAPANRAATNLAGLVLLNQHRFDEARDLAEQILVKMPDDPMALGTLSDALLETGRYPEATKAAQRMQDLKPNLPSYLRAAHLEWLRGDTKAATETMHHAIDAGRDPKDPEPRCWALVEAAMIFWHQGDYPGADAGFQMALKECSDYPPALVGRGRIALANGDYAKAAEHLAQAYKASPLPDTAWLLGDARAAAGDAKGADEAYALVVKGGKASDPRTLALFYATKDREHDEAVRLAQAEKKIRDDIYTADALAWALYRAGKIPEAKAAAEKATSLGTKDARLLYHAGAIRIAAGDKAAGEKLVKEALALNPKFDWTGAAEAAKLAGK